MTTDEKLDRIVAKCREILTLGEKRTPGSWMHHTNVADRGEHWVWRDNGDIYYNGVAQCLIDDHGGESPQEQADADFIAALAGPAEAMARSTIAAISGLRVIHNETQGDADGAPDATAHARLSNMVSDYAKKQLDAILAAWEGIV